MLVHKRMKTNSWPYFAQDSSNLTSSARCLYSRQRALYCPAAMSTGSTSDIDTSLGSWRRVKISFVFWNRAYSLTRTVSTAFKKYSVTILQRFLGNKRLTTSIGWPELPTAVPLATLLLVRLFLRNTTNISCAARANIFLNSAVADSVLGAKWGE